MLPLTSCVGIMSDTGHTFNLRCQCYIAGYHIYYNSQSEVSVSCKQEELEQLCGPEVVANLE